MKKPKAILVIPHLSRRFDSSITLSVYLISWNGLNSQTKVYLPHPLKEEITQLIDTTVRASSVVENLNSRLRNYFFLRKQLGPEYLDLLRFFLNHRRFMRSEHPERVGKSPAEILTGKKHAHWLELLGGERFKKSA